MNNEQTQTAMKFKRYTNEDGCYQWESGEFQIIRSGGIDRQGHFTYNLGYYGVQKNGELQGWVRTLAEAKDYASTLS